MTPETTMTPIRRETKQRQANVLAFPMTAQAMAAAEAKAAAAAKAEAARADVERIHPTPAPGKAPRCHVWCMGYWMMHKVAEYVVACEVVTDSDLAFIRKMANLPARPTTRQIARTNKIADSIEQALIGWEPERGA
jgi:hypothetical protein